MNKSGVVLIVLGVLFLAHNFGLLQFAWLSQWWPLILIALGIWSLINHKPADKSSSGTDKPQA
jgi:cadmium resistance protein CadD (predicted permease)